MSIANKSAGERQLDATAITQPHEPVLRIEGDRPASSQSKDVTAPSLVPPRDASPPARSAYTLLLEALARLAQDGGTASDLLTVYRALVQFACASCPATGLYVTRYDAERREMRCVYAWT